jgi:hypothetical protein
VKYKNILIAVFSGFCLLAFTNFVFGYKKCDSKKEIEVIVSFTKDSYLLGEVIPLLIEINNLTGKEIILRDTIDPIYGSLTLYVTNDTKTVESQYMNPKFGILESNSIIKIKAGERQSNSIQILAKLKSDNEATYFLDKAGTYNLLASYHIQLAGQAKPIEIKSESIKLNIAEPAEDDSEVWNKIKDNGNIAYFLQEGDFNIPLYKLKEKEKLKQEIEQIIIDYPNSFYAKSFKKSLEKFEVVEEKRKAFQEKIKTSQPK